VPAGVPVCGTCLRQPPPLDLCLAAVDYAYPWHAVIGDFKFRADTGLARPLAGLMDWMPGVDEALAWCDALLPMPLSDTRLRERGFHQTLLLARALARGRAALVPPRAIRRSHTATAQHDLPRSQRLRQLRSAFAVAPGQQALIAGRRLLLLDDVMTTGASLHALAHCLRRAGAAGVGALVLARTPL
jgi:ComF family protein